MRVSDILQIGDAVALHRPVDRAMAILGCVFPERSAPELSALPIGQRDALLLSLREETLGPLLRSTTRCPRCATQIDQVLDSRQLTMTSAPASAPHELVCGSYFLRFRLPSSLDVAAMAELSPAEAAISGLLCRCVLLAEREGQAIPIEELPVQVVEALSAAMAEADPQGEILLSLKCPSCAHPWDAVFDVAAFFLSELSVLERRLIREISILAQAYGWREEDILAMSNRRRRLYIEAVGA